MGGVLKRTRKFAVTGTALGVAFASVPAGVASAEETTAPKNIIVLISDGAGYNQFDAASLYEHGQSLNQVSVDPATGAVQRVPGTPTQVYENFPVKVSQSHYSANGRASYTPEQAWGSFDWVASGATDSAAAATALGTGVKTNNGVIGFDPAGQKLLTVGEQAKAVGKKVGVVTSVPFNHATPAGFIAHNADRNDYQGLATEMIDSGADVIMGGGHPNYTDAHTSRASNWTWISQDDFQRVSGGGTDFSYVETRSDFEALATATEVPEKVFGLAQVAETLQYNRPGLGNKNVKPGADARNDVASLDVMAKGALNVLDKDEDGFFLMVEGGAVDWAGHANQTTRLVEEQVEFNRSVEAVTDWVERNSSWDETLVVVTADHETGYLAGPGSKPTWTPMTGAKGELPQVSWHSGGHTNALVPFYAKGAGSDVLNARADKWDTVRGAYLDNTAVGETVFDLLGHAPASADSAVALEASVPLPSTAGDLSMTVADSGTVRFTGDRTQTGALPQVTVTDTRNEVQSRGQGWTVSGTAGEFVAGNRKFGAENLGWTPKVVSSDSNAAAGPQAVLDAPAALADTNRVSRYGTTVVGADLGLTVPDEARSGRYGSEITLTLFAKD
ncbi:MULTISPECIES: alkaline phosphatase [Actinosynnema]|uniref:alkaline phosphatase n=1 Tax=Actinosynnema TaxID=40566 RepID=UPI0020A5692D|nr:alkaline phosphatase [Actinosynnema pretiosum]MCP2095825.1 alkaline phosphatase [Actinosynnema pretiosum]